MSGKKILVVDDSQCIVDVLTQKLVEEGYQVCSAMNGAEAIEKALSEKPQGIIMDVMMPGMSGFEAMKKLRENPETRKIPAIIISAKGSMKDFFADISGVEFMPKPLDMELLVRRLEALIGGTQQRAGQPKRVVLGGVEDLLVSKIRTSLSGLHFEVFTALHESDAVLLTRNMKPDLLLCQFWEDEQIFSPREIAAQLSLDATVAKTPFYAYCKESLSLEAMKCFPPDKIVAYKESSDLLRTLEALLKKIFS